MRRGVAPCCGRLPLPLPLGEAFLGLVAAELDGPSSAPRRLALPVDGMAPGSAQGGSVVITTAACLTSAKTQTSAAECCNAILMACDDERLAARRSASSIILQFRESAQGVSLCKCWFNCRSRWRREPSRHVCFILKAYYGLCMQLHRLSATNRKLQGAERARKRSTLLRSMSSIAHRFITYSMKTFGCSKRPCAAYV